MNNHALTSSKVLCKATMFLNVLKTSQWKYLKKWYLLICSKNDAYWNIQKSFAVFESELSCKACQFGKTNRISRKLYSRRNVEEAEYEMDWTSKKGAKSFQLSISRDDISTGTISNDLGVPLEGDNVEMTSIFIEFLKIDFQKKTDIQTESNFPTRWITSTHCEFSY